MAAPKPTLAGFIAFIRNVMGISSENLSDDNPVIPMALSVALAIVNPLLNAVGYTPGIAGVPAVSIYTLAVYNLAGDNVVNYAQDEDPSDTSYFNVLRAKLNINGFVSGVIQSAGDEGTYEAMVVQEAAKNFTLQNLQQLKTPWGRQYLAFAQSYGPTIIGLT